MTLNSLNLAQLNRNVAVDENPLEVPKDKEDVNTADDEISARDAVLGDSPRDDDFGTFTDQPNFDSDNNNQNGNNSIGGGGGGV